MGDRIPSLPLLFLGGGDESLWSFHEQQESKLTKNIKVKGLEIDASLWYSRERLTHYI